MIYFTSKSNDTRKVKLNELGHLVDRRRKRKGKQHYHYYNIRRDTA